MNGQTDRYSTYVCHAGCYDWVSMMATDGYRFFADELGAFHWDNPARVMKQSPHHYVKRAKTPTLVIHGEQDYRVPATQALQYYDTLQREGRVGAPALVPRREPLDPEAAEFPALVPRVLRLGGERYAPGGAGSARARLSVSDAGLRPVRSCLVRLLAFEAAGGRRIGRQSRRRDGLAAVDAHAVAAVAHARRARRRLRSVP